MLTKFAVTNYRGFSKRIEFDLSHPSNYLFNDYAVKNGFIKNGIVYGPNGSGKSNLALSLFDIVNHLTQKWKKPDYYNNFTYAGNPSAPVEFEYSFQLSTDFIFYKYTKNTKGELLTEELRVNGKEIFFCSAGILRIEDSYSMDASVKKSLANNANRVSVVNYLLTSFPLQEDHYLIKLQQFVNSMLWFRCLETREFIGLDNNATVIDEYIISHNLVFDFQDFIEAVSTQKFDFVKPDEGDKVIYCQYGSNKIPFDQVSSTGTQSLMLLYYWIKQLDKASFVFIDEFDAFYHFKLAYEVCRRLFQLDCQTFVSSHNTYLMTNDLLRPDCNFILNDNKIKPLNECTEKELRFGHNIEKMFRGGTFAL